MTPFYYLSHTGKTIRQAFAKTDVHRATVVLQTAEYILGRTKTGFMLFTTSLEKVDTRVRQNKDMLKKLILSLPAAGEVK